jgi:hypothetical protein
MTAALSATAIVAAVAEHAAERITSRAIRGLQRMPSGISGEESGLANVWNEICVQVQHEHSFAWNAYDQTAVPLSTRWWMSCSRTNRPRSGCKLTRASSGTATTMPSGPAIPSPHMTLPPIR